MMRPFKFRAWHKAEKRMFQVFHLSWHFGIFLIGDKNSLEGRRYGSGEIELMQFTGLTDRHGKDVYEGDIYRNLDNGLLGTFYYLNGPGGYTLYCREQKRDGSIYNMLPFAQLDTTNFEVLGNIYEHADLLAVQP